MSQDQGFSLLQVERPDWLMFFSAFFDESGKFKDHSTVAFCGIVAPPESFTSFGDEWKRHLVRAGLKVLTMKHVLRSNVPLSKKRPALGSSARIAALMPFVECIRKHLNIVIATALDTVAFHALPSHTRRILDNDPHFTAFTRAVVEALQPLRKDDQISIICDDEEAVALPMYRLYRMVKRHYADARNRLVALSFADDEVFFALQAADLIASLIRLEARLRFHSEPYDYAPLFEALHNPKTEDRLWALNAGFWGKDDLAKVANAYRELEQELQKEHPGAKLELGLIELSEITAGR